MGRTRLVSTAGVIAIVAVAIASCSSSSTGPKKTSTSLAGTYTLLSITLPPNPTFGPPIATGTLTLADSTYDVVMILSVPTQPVDTIADQGTYTTSGNTWTQTSTVIGVQSVGTYALSGDTLSVDVSTSGQQESTVWLKQ